jgi:integrase
MRSFESFLAPELEAYIRHRASIGHKDKNLRSLLRPFDLYIKEAKADWGSLKPTFFLGMKETLNGEASTVNGILSAIRCFFAFLVYRGDIAQNPLRDVPPLPLRPYIPFVFSLEEIENLLRAIQKGMYAQHGHALRNTSIYIAILLMARCGLRVSEPLKLLLRDYDPEDGTIYITKSKFQTDRIIPIPKSVMVEIEEYLVTRNPHAKNDYLLIGEKQNPLSTHHIYPVFRQAVKEIGRDQSRRIEANIIFAPPTPHSLRHSFAVNTLKLIAKRGKSMRTALPLLANYMGHRSIVSTSRYLKVPSAEHRLKLLDFAIAHWWEV